MRNEISRPTPSRSALERHAILRIMIALHARIRACSQAKPPGPRLNARGVYLKLNLVDPAFIQTWRLFGTWHSNIEKLQ